MTGMSRDEVLALPVVVDLVTAGRAWGWTRSRVYEHQAAGELPFAVVTVGGRYRVTREALLTSLGIDPAATSNSAEATSATVPDMSDGAGPTPAPTATTEATAEKGLRHDGNAPRAIRATA